MLANWGASAQTRHYSLANSRVAYYRYVNAHGSGIGSAAFLVVGVFTHCRLDP